MMHKAWNSIEEVSYFKVIHQISRWHGTKNRRFWCKFGVSGLWLHFDITDGYGMIHKAWSSIKEVPYCFSRSSIKCQGHTGQKIADFHPNLAFPDCNFMLNRWMAMKWSTKLELAEKMCPFAFQGHPSNLEVTGGKSHILTQIARFRTVTPVWIKRWLWNDAQSLT